MELGGEKGLALVTYAFVGAVVQVYEQGFPVAAQAVVVNSVAVILGSNVASVASGHLHRLVVAAVAVFKFEDARASGFGQ